MRAGKERDCARERWITAHKDCGRDGGARGRAKTADGWDNGRMPAGRTRPLAVQGMAMHMGRGGRRSFSGEITIERRQGGGRMHVFGRMGVAGRGVRGSACGQLCVGGIAP